MKLSPIRYAILFAALVISTTAFGKGETVALTISGPGLGGPLQADEGDAIDVSVWGGDFAELGAESLNEPPSELPRYLVHFWVQLSESDTVQLKYVVGFVWDPTERRALIHLPGPLSEWYRTNTRSILRDGQDGHWFYATDFWGKAIRQLIEAA